MKNMHTKINDLWIQWRIWGEVSILGYLVVGTIKLVVCVVVVYFVFYQPFIGRHFEDDEEKLAQNYSLPISQTPQPKYYPSPQPPVSNLDDSTNTNDDCSVIGISLHGTVLTYIPNHSESDSSFDYDVVSSENIAGTIKQANEDTKIKAILVEVDSGGGYPVAGEEISNAVENSEKPVLAVIRGRGASAAYLAISGADKIIASKNSEVGSIGVTSSYVSNVEKNRKDGYMYEQLSAGKYKDSGDPDKPLTSEERELFLRDINIIYNNFIEVVAQNRKIPIGKVSSFADGSTVLGEKAKSLGLIDEIGGINEVEKYLEETIGEKPEVCWK